MIKLLLKYDSDRLKSRSGHDMMKETDFTLNRGNLQAVTIATSIPLTTKHFEKIAQQFESQMNDLGADGWELVQHVDGFFFFKREIE